LAAQDEPFVKIPFGRGQTQAADEHSTLPLPDEPRRADAWAQFDLDIADGQARRIRRLKWA
jgi:hypothetical protein